MKFEVGQKWKTRGGWEAQIVWITRNPTEWHICAIHLDSAIKGDFPAIAVHCYTPNDIQLKTKEIIYQDLWHKKSDYSLVLLIDEKLRSCSDCIYETGTNRRITCPKHEQPKPLKLELGRRYLTQGFTDVTITVISGDQAIGHLGENRYVSYTLDGHHHACDQMNCVTPCKYNVIAQYGTENKPIKPGENRVVRDGDKTHTITNQGDTDIYIGKTCNCPMIEVLEYGHRKGCPEEKKK